MRNYSYIGKRLNPMKKEIRILLAAAVFAVAGAVTAQAGDIAPVTGHWTTLGADRSALVYYIDEPNGFHVVVTTQQGRTSRAAVERFETVLAAGQSAAVSIPRGAGEAPARIVLSNAGDHLHIAEPIAAASVQ
jgi:ABC-type glycerol-3-phosphate transport system substrate-binding protein